jgi:hypothetical protein
MFGFTRATYDVTWKSIEGDFLLGTCSRRIFGFATRSADGTWSAFDDESRSLGVFATVDDVKSLLWQSHRQTHDTACAAPIERHSRSTPVERPSPAPEPSRNAKVRPRSW